MPSWTQASRRCTVISFTTGDTKEQSTRRKSKKKANFFWISAVQLLLVTFTLSTTATRTRELIVKYRSLQEGPQSRDLEQWLDDWIHITNQCREADLPETTGYRAQEDFLSAIRTIAPEWAGSSHHDLIMKETAGRTNEIQPVADYIAQFRIYHRRIGPTAASLGTFASLGVSAKS